MLVSARLIRGCNVCTDEGCSALYSDYTTDDEYKSSMMKCTNLPIVSKPALFS